MRGEPTLIKLTDRKGQIKSPYWYIQYFDGERGQRCSTRCRIGEEDHEAQIALSSFILERERPVARKPDELMIAQVLHDYQEEHGKHVATADHVKRHKSVLTSFFGIEPISAITQGKISRFYRERKQSGVGNGTIRRELAILKASLNHAVREGRLLNAPQFKLPVAPSPKERYLNPEEADRLLSACQSVHLFAFMVIALNTGQRTKAIEELTWFQVDLRNRIIDFNPPGRMQTNKRRVPVPINDVLADMLEDMFSQKTTEYVLEWKGSRAGDVKKSFHRAVLKAKLENVSRHTLRHTAATWMAQKGVPLFQIAGILGHTSITTTVRHYAKHQPEFLREAIVALNETTQKLRKYKNRGSKNATTY